MRPKSIVTFERLALLSLAIALIVTIFTWHETAAAFRVSGYPASLPLISAVVEFGVGLALILLISKKGSRVAKWILATLTAAGVVELAIRSANGFGGDWVDIAEIAKMLLLAASVCLLFGADAKPWFARRPRDGQPVT
jgi:hypothetical protein